MILQLIMLLIHLVKKLKVLRRGRLCEGLVS